MDSSSRRFCCAQRLLISNTLRRVIWGQTANLIAPPDDLSGDEVGEVFQLPRRDGQPLRRASGRSAPFVGGPHDTSCLTAHRSSRETSYRVVGSLHASQRSRAYLCGGWFCAFTQFSRNV